MCGASAPSLQLHPMPPRITEKSCRPRVSDRTMVGNSATRLACEFQKTEWRRHDSDMKPQRGRSIEGPSLRGLWGRSATGQNGQAAANKEVSAVWSEGWMSKNISGVPAGRSVFHLTSPFIGLTENWAPHEPYVGGMAQRVQRRLPSGSSI